MNEIYSIWDAKAEYYMPFFCERNDMTAIRVLEAAMTPDHPIYKNAEDFQLFHIGTWNPEEGVVKSTTPKHVTDAWVIKAKTLNNKELE